MTEITGPESTFQDYTIREAPLRDPNVSGNPPGVLHRSHRYGLFVLQDHAQVFYAPGDVVAFDPGVDVAHLNPVGIARGMRAHGNTANLWTRTEWNSEPDGVSPTPISSDIVEIPAILKELPEEGNRRLGMLLRHTLLDHAAALSGQVTQFHRGSRVRQDTLLPMIEERLVAIELINADYQSEEVIKQASLAVPAKERAIGDILMMCDVAAGAAFLAQDAVSASRKAARSLGFENFYFPTMDAATVPTYE